MKQASNKRTDFYLVQRALCGDQSAYRKIYGKYHSMVAWHVYKRVPDPLLIDDIVAETFAKAFESLDTYAPTYQLSAWLVRIGRNCAIDHVRRRRMIAVSIDAPIGGDEDGQEVQVPDPDAVAPDVECERGENARRIAALLDKMPVEMAKVLRMRYVYEMGYDEIGAMCGMSEDDAHRLCHRAKKAFRRAVYGDSALREEFSICRRACVD